MDYYKKSKKIFKEKVRKNKEITKIEWDKYAYDNCLFSANTLMFHMDVKSFENLKERLS